MVRRYFDEDCRCFVVKGDRESGYTLDAESTFDDFSAHWYFHDINMAVNSVKCMSSGELSYYSEDAFDHNYEIMSTFKRLEGRHE